MQITKEEVKQILEKVKACVHNDKFRISLNPNRIENQSFINDYRLTTKQQKRMILELDIYDFSKIDIDRKNKIQILYFFGREYELNHKDRGLENVETYIKELYGTEDKFYPFKVGISAVTAASVAPDVLAYLINVRNCGSYYNIIINGKS